MKQIYKELMTVFLKLGSFRMGENAKDAVYNAKVLEEVAKINILSNTINPTQSVSNTLLDKHYLRKHGKGAYYGQ